MPWSPSIFTKRKEHPLSTICQHLGICNGCHFEKIIYQDQLLQKQQMLADLLRAESIAFPEITLKTSGENFLRQRFDFTIENDRMGLYGKDHKLIDIKQCLQLAPDLLAAFLDFKKIIFPIKKGSVRLRVGPSGLRGAWLDFANIDIKNLLESKASFEQVLNLGFKIEIGQKAKTLSKIEGHFKLTDPTPQKWFQSQNLLLDCFISSFTQPSWVTADMLTDTILSWLPSKPSLICEFGSGIGQFTLPLLDKGHSVDVFESDVQATELVKRNASTQQLQNNLLVYHGDFQNQPIPDEKKYELVLVNPPRSGLKGFTEQIISINSKKIIYISCFPESLVVDLKKLTASGFAIKEISLVDQFPQTKHFETCVLLERIHL